MTDETNKMNTLIAACWKDDALKQRFLSDPHAVLAEHGMDVPEGINVNVVENTDNTVHVTLPAAPEGHANLSDEELGNAAGGNQVQTTLGCGNQTAAGNQCFVCVVNSNPSVKSTPLQAIIVIAALMGRTNVGVSPASMYRFRIPASTSYSPLICSSS